MSMFDNIRQSMFRPVPPMAPVPMPAPEASALPQALPQGYPQAPQGAQGQGAQSNGDMMQFMGMGKPGGNPGAQTPGDASMFMGGGQGGGGPDISMLLKIASMFMGA